MREHVLVVRGSSVHSCSLDEYGGVFGLQESPLGKHVSQFDGITPAYSPVVEPVGNTSFLLAVAFSEMGFWAAW